MSLNLSRLEKVRELAGGVVQARCPACAEGGHDRTGEHLRIYPDGRFGCCVHPKDGEHRRRIFALVGDRKAGTFTLRVKTPPALAAGRSVKAALTTSSFGTLGTPVSDSVSCVPAVPTLPVGDFGTLGTGHFELRACARGELPTAVEDLEVKLKESERPVPSVPTRLPFLTADGTLSIPFDSPVRYHWWKGGQSVAETRREVERKETHAVTV